MSNEYKQTLARFEQAVRDHEMRGSLPPDERCSVETEYEDARRNLVTKLTYRTAK